MKQPHDEIIKNWTARAAKLKAAYMDSEKPDEYSQKALRLYFTLVLQIAIVSADKKKKAAQNFVPGGIVSGHYNGEPEYITPLSNFYNA